jgi:HAMP domain-containing protein
VTLALMAVRTVAVGDMKLYVAGGRKLDREFIASLVAPQGMRVLLYRNLAPAFAPAELIDAGGPVASSALLRPLVEQVETQRARRSAPSAAAPSAETFHALPLKGTRERRAGRAADRQFAPRSGGTGSSMLQTAVIVAVTGILLAIVLSWWATARITRPVQQLAESAGRVAAGNWGATVEVASQDEIGQLARRSIA